MEVDVTQRRTPAPEIERFWARVDRSGDCWLWTAALNRGGYGRFYLSGSGPHRGKQAHRWIYEQLFGPVPPELNVDHLCHGRDLSCPGGVTCPHRRCVNPAHLEPVTPKVNSSRTRQATKTHCSRGHLYDEANTYRSPAGLRQCRRCHAAQEAAARRAKVTKLAKEG